MSVTLYWYFSCRKQIHLGLFHWVVTQSLVTQRPARISVSRLRSMEGAHIILLQTIGTKWQSESFFFSVFDLLPFNVLGKPFVSLAFLCVIVFLTYLFVADYRTAVLRQNQVTILLQFSVEINWKYDRIFLV